MSLPVVAPRCSCGQQKLSSGYGWICPHCDLLSDLDRTIKREIDRLFPVINEVDE